MVFTNWTHKDLKEIKRAKRQSTHSVRERHTQKRQISSTRRCFWRAPTTHSAPKRGVRTLDSDNSWSVWLIDVDWRWDRDWKEEADSSSLLFTGIEKVKEMMPFCLLQGLPQHSTLISRSRTLSYPLLSLACFFFYMHFICNIFQLPRVNR